MATHRITTSLLIMLALGTLCAGQIVVVEPADTEAVVVKPALAEPATRPTTQPALTDVQIKGLIEQLGDSDFQTRDTAQSQLLSAGKTVLPALREAVKSDDPEVRSRCEAMIAQIEKPKTPAGRRNGPVMVNGGQIHVVQIGGAAGGAVFVGGVNNGQRQISVTANGRTVAITENDEGITVKVTQPVDGKDKTEEFAAKNLDELKEKHPEAAKLYETYANRGANQIQIRFEAVGGNGRVIVAPPQPEENDDAERK